MAFVEKSFSNGETLPATDLNEMDQNDDHVRHEAAWKSVLNLAQVVEDSESNTRFRLKINTTPIGTQRTGTGNFTETNIPLSGFTDNAVHVIYLEIGTPPFSYDYGFRFYKTPDMDYLSYWGNMEALTFDVRVNSLTVICHRETI